MPEIDLHTHSTASDGTLSPAELVTQAKAMGLRALALTDHDTIQGLPEACATGIALDFEVIGGCELSVSFARGSMHLLGLWLPRQPQALQSSLDHLNQMREIRNKAIIENLRQHNVPVTYAELQDLAAGATIGRPHIAQLLVHKNRARDIRDAFATWLQPGTKGYVPKEKLAPRTAIDLLKAEGATVILAHPCTLHLDKTELHSELQKLKSWGLDGIEVHYSMHSQAQTNTYAELCRQLDLLQSAGSDFHGANKPNIALGRGKGGLRPSYRLVELMKEHRVTQGLAVSACA